MYPYHKRPFLRQDEQALPDKPDVADGAEPLVLRTPMRGGIQQVRRSSGRRVARHPEQGGATVRHIYPRPWAVLRHTDDGSISAAARN
jgi:hypothetical protein